MNLFNLSYFTMSIDAHSSVVDVAEVCEVFKKLSTKVRKIFFLSSFHFNPFPSPGYMLGLIFLCGKVGMRRVKRGLPQTKKIDLVNFC